MTLTEAHLRDVLQLRSHLRVCYRYRVPLGSAHGTCGEFETGLWCRMHVQCQPGRQEFDRPRVSEIVPCIQHQQTL